MIYRRDICHWCGTETLSYKKVGPSHPKCATVDHVRSKPECLSAGEYNQKANKVNACYSCNQRRSTEWTVRAQKGLVFPTEWSLKQAAKEARRRARRKLKDQEREIQKLCPPCPVIRIEVPAELSEAWPA